MRKIAFILIITLATLPLGAQEESKEQAATDTEIASLIKQLGAQDWHKREEAEKKLVEIGRIAGPALVNAESSEDFDISRRATMILDKICYLPGEVQEKFDKLLEDLKSHDNYKRAEALSNLMEMDGKAPRYIRKFLCQPSDKKVKVEIIPEKMVIKPNEKLKYMLYMKNEGRKPVWVAYPPQRRKVWHRRFFAKQRERGSFSCSCCCESGFDFIFLQPNEEFSEERTFDPFDCYSGWHNLFEHITCADDERIFSAGANKVIDIECFTMENPISIDIAAVPEIYENDIGVGKNGVLTKISITDRKVKSGSGLQLSLSIKNEKPENLIFPYNFNSEIWFVLVPADKKDSVSLSGVVGNTPEATGLEIKIQNGECLDFTGSIKLDVERGEYLLICGYSQTSFDSPDNIFHGEISSNAVRVEVTGTKRPFPE